MKKLGSQLATGDVVVYLHQMTQERRVVIATYPTHAKPMVVMFAYVTVQAERTSSFQCMPDDEFEVEDRGGVTPEELATLVEAADQLVKLHDSGDAGPALLHPVQHAALAALVDRLAPVAAPTLDEVLGALDVMVATPDLGSATARDILDRARRAGLL